jgi:hypothetical protein
MKITYRYSVDRRLDESQVGLKHCREERQEIPHDLRFSKQ